MERQIRMISAASAVLSLKKQNPMAIDEEVFQHIADYISGEKIRDESIKVAMIAAASEAYRLSRENPGLSEKEILKSIMDTIPVIVQRLDADDN